MGFKSIEKQQANQIKFQKDTQELFEKVIGDLDVVIHMKNQKKKAHKILNPQPKRKF